MIIAYFGKMRSGKTYAMTEEVLRLLNKGEVVYTNYKINWTGQEKKSWLRMVLHRLGLWPVKRYPATNLRTFRTWEEIYDVRECTIALDEGWLYFNSYVRLPIDQQRRLMQSGKRRMDFLYTTQRPLQTDINLRWNTDVFYECRMVKIPFKTYPLFIRKQYDLKEDSDGAIINKVHVTQSGEEIDMCLNTKWLWAKQKIYNAYDTEYEIYENEEAECARSRIEDDLASRAGWDDPCPTYWTSLKTLITGKHDTRRHSTSKKRSKAPVATPVVSRIRRGRVHQYNPVVNIDGVKKLT